MQNYIFFDVECANCYGGKGKICTFGYVVVDENFTILQKEDVLINPAVEKWDWYVIKNMLAYKKKQMEAAPKFDAHYLKIAKLLTENRVCGFDVGLDIKYVNQDCERYNLPGLPVECFDVQDFYKKHTAAENKRGLSGVAEELQLDLTAFNLHKSCDDAEISMLILKELAKITGQSIHQLTNQ